MSPPAFEPTLHLIDNRIAARKQDNTFRPGDPFWVLFSPAELQAMFGPTPEEAQ